LLVLLMGFVQNAEQLVVLRTIQGAVSGVISAASALVAASTPKERTGEAMGLLQTSRWAGLAIGPFVGGLLGDAFGFRESFWITGTLLGIAGFATMLLVQEEFAPAPVRARPSMLGSYRQLLRAPGLGGLYELNFLRSLGQSMVMPIMALFIVELMGTEESAALITGIIFGAAAVMSSLSSVWFGALGDRFGHSRLLIIAALAAMVLYLPQPFVTAAWQLMLLQGFSGLATGAMLPTISALMNLWTPDGNQGAIYGLDTSVNAAARSVAPLIGAAVAYWLNLRGVFGATALVYALIAVLTVHTIRSVQAPPKTVMKGAAD
jgi:DHA1 family multidrug resistance protein-like MFS transporter